MYIPIYIKTIQRNFKVKKSITIEFVTRKFKLTVVVLLSLILLKRDAII